MTIPIADHKWTRLNVPGEFPSGHHIEAAKLDDGGWVVRITGPHAHVLGEGPQLATAVNAAAEWFDSCGGYL